MPVIHRFNYTEVEVRRFYFSFTAKTQRIFLVYDEPACSQTNLDRAVLVIGYGTDSGTDYWLVKNRYVIVLQHIGQ